MQSSLKRIKLICVVLAGFQLLSCSSNRKIASNERETSALMIPANMYPPADSIISTQNAWTRGHYPKRIQVFKEQPLQLHDVVFLGNSITEQGEDWSKRFNIAGLKNRGIAGDVTDGVLARLGEVTYVKPRAVFIEIGINDLFNPTLSAERTANNIIRIAENIKKQSPRTQVFIQTVFPTKNDFLVSKISNTNKIVRDHTNPKLYTLVETHALFADNADLMKKEYTKDGVHLNEKGYEVWINHLRQFFK